MMVMIMDSFMPIVEARREIPDTHIILYECIEYNESGCHFPPG